MKLPANVKAKKTFEEEKNIKRKSYQAFIGYLFLELLFSQNLARKSYLVQRKKMPIRFLLNFYKKLSLISGKAN